MTVMRDAVGVTRGGGYAGWSLLPSPATQPRSAAAPSDPAAVPARTPEVDDLVAVAAALNDGAHIVYVDRRPTRAA
ncbi:hypothetical protein ABZ508_34220 [Streptomyces lavendulocolor]|uniref:Uncharacterized protein n=1 Tax=Streptomyces lavendulocolor TaxID=67316 RepID=A0ABV2WGD7_9ACTN